MDVAEAKESPRPAEPELTFQRDGVRLGAERTSRLATGKELEAEGSPIMDDRANDGRGARMASEGAGHGSDQWQHGLHGEPIQSKDLRLNGRTMSDARSRGLRSNLAASGATASAGHGSGETGGRL